LTEKGRLFEQKIEAERDHLVRVREAAARRGGESGSGLGGNEGEGDESEGVSDDDENPFVGGGFENVDSSAMAALWTQKTIFNGMSTVSPRPHSCRYAATYAGIHAMRGMT
jgi:hypothetical protein